MLILAFYLKTLSSAKSIQRRWKVNQRWVWSVVGVMLTGKNRSTGRKTYPSATSSTTNLTRTGLVSKGGVRNDRPRETSRRLRWNL